MPSGGALYGLLLLSCCLEPVGKETQMGGSEAASRKKEKGNSNLLSRDLLRCLKDHSREKTEEVLSTFYFPKMKHVRQS